MLFARYAHYIAKWQLYGIGAFGDRDVLLTCADENAGPRDSWLVIALDAPDSETFGQCNLHMQTFLPRQHVHDPAAVDIETKKFSHEGRLRARKHVARIPNGFDS